MPEEEEELEREDAPDLYEKEAHTTALYEPFLTPPDTPPAALLAGLIQIPAGHLASSQHVPEEHYVWQAIFNVGRLGNTVM